MVLNINHVSIYGSIAIMFAFQNGHTDVVIYLLNKGAKITTDKKTTTGFYESTHRYEYTKMLEQSNELYSKLQNVIYVLNKKLENLNMWKTDIAHVLEDEMRQKYTPTPSDNTPIGNTLLISIFIGI